MSNAFAKFDLTGKNAVVTAGGTGLGYHISRALAQAGARVLICARREHVLRQAAAELLADPLIKEIRYHCVDLSSRPSIKALVDYARYDFGGVDIFVGNAGEVASEYVDQISNTAIDRVLQVNFASNVELIREFLPDMRKKRWGRFIFSSSVGSLVSSPNVGMAMYGATKAAMNAFVRTAATEAGHDRITVNSLVLGFYFTEMMRESCARREKVQAGAAKEYVEEFSSMTALGRFGNPEEIEGLIQLLASDAGSYITGSSVVIDGGMSIMMRPNKLATYVAQ